MTVSTPAMAHGPSSVTAPRGSLPFRGLWLFSPRADAAFLVLPILLTMGSAVVSALVGFRAADEVNRLAVWTAQNILGNGTHVVLTYLLFAVHRDVLTAEPGQPRRVLLGTLAMLAVGVGFIFTYYANKDAHVYVVGVLFNVFGLHHTLSQHKGFWALHSLRGHQAGLGAGPPRERSLQQVYVPLMLTLILVRLFFVPDSAAPGATPYLDVGQGALLPHGALAVILAVWLGFFALLFRTMLRAGNASGPKVLYLLAAATATGLTLVAPMWGNVMLPAMHGLEYYMITARMMEPREGDPPARLGRAWIWPLMILSMSPLLALGVIHGLILEGAGRGLLGTGDPSGSSAHLILRVLTSLSLGVVLAHYFADAFIYRFRIPSIRKVMLRRLGFAPPAVLASAPAAPTASTGSMPPMASVG
ncbi:hypothetical protein [Hyalangium sp.]|uniref:hypothetical protein n=1 Tax=Hyalangium sp. TaxID=2028555 RepID=UPI002D38D4F5|nr:hypothetical protein [Hyalangium sp.]HYH96850.1 hypothetical protein [Hyalangium sp.]